MCRGKREWQKQNVNLAPLCRAGGGWTQMVAGGAITAKTVIPVKY